jgi:hypothetical protein
MWNGRVVLLFSGIRTDGGKPLDTAVSTDFFRSDIRTRDHPNSKHERKAICLLDFHSFINLRIYCKLI